MARPRTFDEAQVIETAKQTFWDRGYAATSIDDLSAATGLGRGSLYATFKGKHEIFVRALTDYTSAALADWTVNLEGGDPLERLRELVRGMARGIAGESALRGCMMAKSASERSVDDSDVLDTTRATLTSMREALQQNLAAAKAAGQLQNDANVDALASMLLALLRGAEALGKGGISTEVITEAAEQALALLPVTAGNEETQLPAAAPQTV